MSFQPTVEPPSLDFLNAEASNVQEITAWIKQEIMYYMGSGDCSNTEELRQMIASIYLYVLDKCQLSLNENLANVYFEGQYVYDEEDNESQKGNYFVREKIIFVYQSTGEGTAVTIPSWYDEGLFYATNEFVRVMINLKENQ